MSKNQLATSSKRLRFIDLARSIAIIMMLQGHFIALTYDDYFAQVDLINANGFSDNFGFDIWFQLRSLTAPMFFTVTGLVFVYLLLANPDTPFFKQKRVRKGIRRAFYIIFWGYLLQLNYQSLSYYLAGNINQRFFAFHVLQSIGTSILLLIIVYGIYKLIKGIIPLYVLLFALGVVVFLFNPILKGSEQYFPQGAHVIFQNMIKGPKSFFPLIPWAGFVFIGGSIGAFIRTNTELIKQRSFIFKFIGYGVSFCLIMLGVFYLLDMSGVPFWEQKTPFIQTLFIILILGILMLFEPRLKRSDTLIMAMGQNTLFIYILHVMLLYGALIGIGLRTWYEHSLSFAIAVLGAIGFVLFFAFLVKLLPYYEKAKQKVLTSLGLAKA